MNNIKWKRTRLIDAVPRHLRYAFRKVNVLLYTIEGNNPDKDVVIFKNKEERVFRIRRFDKNEIVVKTLRQAKKIVETRLTP